MISQRIESWTGPALIVFARSSERVRAGYTYRLSWVDQARLSLDLRDEVFDGVVGLWRKV